VLELTLVLFSCSFLIIIFVCYLLFPPFVVKIFNETNNMTDSFEVEQFNCAI